MNIDKIIVTNKRALEAKYGNNTSKIISALNKLIASDKTKGIISSLIFMDDKISMKSFSSRAVKNFSIAKENKTAIDDLYWYFSPDYVMIVGAWDVVPHVRLKNLIAKKEDDDRLINSDLPYACEAPYSNLIGNFLSPTRVVGRLPDIVGGDDESYLIKLIENCIASQPRKVSEYSTYFSLSAKVWKGSTSQSLKYLFPDVTSLKLCPDAEGPYLKSDLSSKIHFFNCHGAIAEPEFYGQSGDNYPVSFQSDFIAGNIKPGTVVAAECCYGADLYHPREGSSKKGIANTYLENNALGFVGSTTIAYGPATGQGSADYITQFFVKGIQKGSSLGRSFLEARHKFIELSAPKFDPVELKTIAQFILLGDPSVQLVEISPKNVGVEEGTSGEEKLMANKNNRKDRRLRMTVKGVFLGQIAHAPHAKKTKVAPAMKKKLHTILRQHDFTVKEGTSFDFRNAKGVFKNLDKSVVRYHMFVEHKQNEKLATKFPKLKRTKIIIIKESDSVITEVRKYERK
jgi:hypothetical protein